MMTQVPLPLWPDAVSAVLSPTASDLDSVPAHSRIGGGGGATHRPRVQLLVASWGSGGRAPCAARVLLSQKGST
eukprot:2996319-Pyramimonas_sp.AAC.4